MAFLCQYHIALIFSLRVHFEIIQCKPSNYALVKIVSVIVGPLYFLINFRISSIKNSAEILTEIALNVQIGLGRIAVLILSSVFQSISSWFYFFHICFFFSISLLSTLGCFCFLCLFQVSLLFQSLQVEAQGIGLRSFFSDNGVESHNVASEHCFGCFHEFWYFVVLFSFNLKYRKIYLVISFFSTCVAQKYVI